MDRHRLHTREMTNRRDRNGMRAKMFERMSSGSDDIGVAQKDEGPERREIKVAGRCLSLRGPAFDQRKRRFSRCNCVLLRGVRSSDWRHTTPEALVCQKLLDELFRQLVYSVGPSLRSAPACLAHVLLVPVHFIQFQEPSRQILWRRSDADDRCSSVYTVSTPNEERVWDTGCTGYVYT